VSLSEKIIEIPRCYDSHVHWLATGDKINFIDLSTVKSLADFIKKAPNWNRPNRGKWIIGFGWDENLWTDHFKPHHKILDQFFPDHPVSFIRADGHSTWVNKVAMQEAGLSQGWIPVLPAGGRIELDDRGLPSGVFIDAAKDHLDKSIPHPSRAEMKSYLVQGMEVFLNSGFTHIRDVGGNRTHWELASEINLENKLKLFVEMLFNLDDINFLSERIKEIIDCRKDNNERLRVSGLKLYYDGALGSDGAYLSQNYHGKDHCGLRLFELSKIEEILHRCWEKNIPVAIHTLGDEAVHQVVQVALKLKERKIEGKLNLEHCELVRDETITLMKSLNVQCHLQPSHFLSDRIWLRKKLGDLYQYCFPWKKLINAGISVSFGSDSPIEDPSLIRTQEALILAQKEGIELPNIPEPLILHSHPDVDWGANCLTELKLDNQEIKIQYN